MRVLICHVHYRLAGGEDAVFETEVGILRTAGLDVRVVEVASDDVFTLPWRDRLAIVSRYADHNPGRRLVRQAVTSFRPDVVHFHNIYPLFGPGAIAEADRLGCATVQTLHNYRLSCLAGTHLLKGESCERCRPRHLAAGVRFGCYRGSRLQSALAYAATRKQWDNFVHARQPLLWLALTTFMRDQFVNSGAPGERIVVKANSVQAGRPDARPRSGVFWGGRLSSEKGIVQLLRVWPSDAPVLTVAGSGPLEREVRRLTRDNVRFVGRLDMRAMRRALRSAAVVAMPSVSPEPLPLVALEALAEGTPVVSFAGWSLGRVVEQLSPRCVVPLHDFESLARRAQQIERDPEWAALNARAAKLWAQRYSHEVNVDRLTRVYSTAVAAKRGEIDVREFRQELACLGTE